MTVQEAAKRLEVSDDLVYALCRTGKLGHVRIGFGRGTIRISEEDLTAYLESVRSAAPARESQVQLKHIKIRKRAT